MAESEALALVVGLVMLAAMVAYIVLAGADFGGGIWDLLARGPRAAEQRAAIATAIGPVWEANHVWLIFVIVLLFTAYPAAFAVLNVALFWPFHLVLAGIVLRGSAFVFRAHGRAAGRVSLGWGAVFGTASVITPPLLGAALGAVSTGRIRVQQGVVMPGSEAAWLGALPLAIGALVLVLCTYLAAVYLAVETEGPVRDDFRRRALGAWLIGGILSLGTLLLTRIETPRLWNALIGEPAAPIVAAGILLAPASALAMWRRRFVLARTLAVGQVTALLLGWAVAQQPYIIYPDLTLAASAAPPATLSLVLWSLPFGLALILPSLWFLFAVFKGRNPAA